jgi:SAM-dependent methyltransferase
VGDDDRRAPRFYERRSLQVESYDAANLTVPGGDDAGFLRRLAQEVGGPVLELGCGTGRVAIPLAEAGFEVVGLDLSTPMLAIADAKRRSLTSDVRRRVRFVEADMRDFRLRRRFGLAFAAFRAFQHLLEPADQRAAIDATRRHLRPGGLLVLDLFDPRLRWVDEGAEWEEVDETVHPVTGRLVRRTAIDRINEPVRQRTTILFRLEELEHDGTVVRAETEELVLRWTYRQELWHLLELEGFEPVAEYSDYAGSPPRYGGEIIAVARKASRRPGPSGGRAEAEEVDRG